ncbi:hypothetical protein [Archangium primigenium]|uniref:hypothetical protein n=1 Tax=[Archangium] primigenium TaxID=2792470 RepID=UPI001EF870DB|nr:hypothetical protein [Archangium primigenium]
MPELNPMLDPTPMAQRAQLTRSEPGQDVTAPSPMGPPSTFQPTERLPSGQLAPVGPPADAFHPVPKAAPELTSVPLPVPRPEHLSTQAPLQAPIPMQRPANLGAPPSTPAGAGTIRFGADANQAAVSEHTRQVLQDIMAQAGVADLRITSTARTPERQALAMYNNIQSQGVASQKELYGAPGDRVVDAYVAGKEAGLSRDEILQAMTAQIHAEGPANVSRHMANDPSALNVIDISPDSIARDQRPAFLEAARNHPSVSRVLDPSNKDPAFHLEINQPQ